MSINAYKLCVAKNALKKILYGQIDAAQARSNGHIRRNGAD
jgi:hypothetical protein